MIGRKRQPQRRTLGRCLLLSPVNAGFLLLKFLYSPQKDTTMLPINEIICGRNESVLATFPADCIDLTVTSPPYDNLRTYKGFEWDFNSTAEQLYRVTKQGGVVVWVVADATINGSETGTSFRQALYFMECGFNLHDTMIYHRESQPRQSNRYEQHFEYMFILTKDKPKTTNLMQVRCVQAGTIQRRNSRDNNSDVLVKSVNVTAETKNKGNVWVYGVGGAHNTADTYTTAHPGSFPEKLAEDHILSWSNPGDLILDPFAGSGTTPKMAIKHHRQFIGIDISAEYCELTRKRIGCVQQSLFSMVG